MVGGLVYTGKVRIVFTKHALVDKFAELKGHKFNLTQDDVTAVINHPEHIDNESDYPKIIVSKTFDKKHILRVVYKIENAIIKVITFYPAEKGRYY